jgi:peptidoglycan/xylan/chitin deacetylase (PgdA/CDA1 family)
VIRTHSPFSLARSLLPVCVLGGVFAFSLAASHPTSQSLSVALTFDDLPSAQTKDVAEAELINRKILAALDRHRAPAIGFVIGKRAEEIGKARGMQLLGDWVHHGYRLGNHTYSHPDLNDISADRFAQEVISNEPFFLPLLPAAERSPLYLRFPYNHTGDTKEKHAAVAAFLAQRGYVVAPCTVDNEDYVFNQAYRAALSRNDAPAAEKIREEYLRYTSVEIDYYASVQRRIFDRPIPHVMLLHASRLNGDLIGEVLGIFETKGYRFITLAAALSDPAYRTPDTLVIPYGWMWGYRWARELGVKVNGNLETEPPAWIPAYASGFAPPFKE